MINETHRKFITVIKNSDKMSNFNGFILITGIIIVILLIIIIMTSNLQALLLLLLVELILGIVLMAKFLFDFFRTDNWVFLILAIIIFIFLLVIIYSTLIIGTIVLASNMKTVTPLNNMQYNPSGNV